MFEKTLDTILNEDINRLVEQERMESVRLDYKRDRPDKWRDVGPGLESAEKANKMWRHKKEFLKDVSALANARGGRLVYGIAENSGIAAKARGVSCDNADALFNELQLLCENHLKPPVRIECAEVGKFERGPILIIQVPNAWNKPHSISINGQRFFYRRYDLTSREMTMGEIRRAFLETAEIEERIRAFRKERVQKLAGNEAPIPLTGDQLMVFHIVPVGTFASGESINVDFQTQYGREWLCPPDVQTHIGYGYNVDGRYAYWGSTNKQRELDEGYAYAQLFRNGAVEGATAFGLPEGEIHPNEIAKTLCQTLRKGWQHGIQADVIEGPFIITISLLGWKGSKLTKDWKRLRNRYIPPIQSDTLLIPEIMLKSVEGDPADYLAPLFDLLWQTCGLPKYDDDSRAKLKQ